MSVTFNADTMRFVEQLGEWIVKSGMFGCDRQEQGHVLAMACVLEGRSPIELLRGYQLSGGKLTRKADAMLGDFQQAGGGWQWLEWSDARAAAIVAWAGRSYEIEYTADEARKAGLFDKKGGTWQRHTAAMLRARLVSKAIRMIAPQVNYGVYTPEEAASIEVADMEPQAGQQQPPAGGDPPVQGEAAAAGGSDIELWS